MTQDELLRAIDKKLNQVLKALEELRKERQAP
jgi:hypothetical protein